MKIEEGSKKKIAIVGMILFTNFDLSNARNFVPTQYVGLWDEVVYRFWEI
jgi:hypothetical protein